MEHLETIYGNLQLGHHKVILDGLRVCPCDATRTIHIPSFVANNYFCESGVNQQWDDNRHFTLNSNDTLWDG